MNRHLALALMVGCIIVAALFRIPELTTNPPGLHFDEAANGILAGDIGGTKTVLALFSKEDGVAGGAVHETRFESDKFSSLEAVIVEFLRETN